MTPTILYEDNHVIAVRKPHGLLVQGDDTGDPTLINEVRYFLKQRENKPGNVFLGMVHRLDRPVGGVVIFGKTSKGAARLSEQFRSRGVEKVYWCVVEGGVGRRGELGEGGVVKQWLLKDEQRNVVTAFDHEVPNAQYAETAWKVMKELGDDRWLIEVRPKTGRPHQIRLAMKTIGMPIVGDVKYGANDPLQLPLGKGEGRSCIALMARALSFDHVVTKERMTVIAEPELEIFYG
ncbi:MAG: RluA family pseudouridine synthase [Patescibacteria group bacterium]